MNITIGSPESKNGRARHLHLRNGHNQHEAGVSAPAFFSAPPVARHAFLVREAFERSPYSYDSDFARALTKALIRLAFELLAPLRFQ